MADPFTKIYIQIVFAVKYRRASIHSSWENELYKYITGIVETRGHKLLAINGMPDHIHIFIGFKPAEPLSDLVREIKKASTGFVKRKGFCPHKFQWQNGYGAFSYSQSHVERVYNYIHNQKQHHQKKSFKKEYLEFIESYEVEKGKKELFKFFNEEEDTDSSNQNH
jgi:REP element-mobilizing transposase RayT